MVWWSSLREAGRRVTLGDKAVVERAQVSVCIAAPLHAALLHQLHGGPRAQDDGAVIFRCARWPSAWAS